MEKSQGTGIESEDYNKEGIWQDNYDAWKNPKERELKVFLIVRKRLRLS